MAEHKTDKKIITSLKPSSDFSEKQTVKTTPLTNPEAQQHLGLQWSKRVKGLCNKVTKLVRDTDDQVESPPTLTEGNDVP